MQHRELELFLHLAGTLNFGRTSLECHLSPATLTRTVQRLEARAGARLLDRGPHGVALTAEGERFRGYARRTVELWSRYDDGADEPAGTMLTGELRLFATVTAARALVPDLLAPLRDAHPRVRLDLRTGDAGAALARVDEGDVDAALAGLPERLPRGLVARTVAVTDLVLVTPRSAHSPGAGGPFVVPRRGLVREAADRWFRTRTTPPVIAAEADGHEGLLALVALGYGTGIVPRLVLTASGDDRFEVTSADLPPFPVGLCVRRDELRRPLVAALWGTVVPGNDGAGRDVEGVDAGPAAGPGATRRG